VFFSRSTIAARCTHGQVLKLTSRYFAMIVLATTFAPPSLEHDSTLEPGPIQAGKEPRRRGG
jgi:hypothetical protein